MNWLLLTDLHLTALARDEYRWGLFQWLINKTEQGYGALSIFILGDLTDAKDFHSAQLINRLVENLVKLYRGTRALEIVILRGNHDGVDPGCPYFRFLRHFPFIKYIETPFAYEVDGLNLQLLPHSRDPETDWHDADLHRADIVLAHVTVTGAVSENGMPLQGTPAALFRTTHAKIYSGDVHVPQKIGKVEYVGAPYPIRFGDKFKPRCVLLNRGKIIEEWHYPTIQRHMLTVSHSKELEKLAVGLRKADQVKVRIRLGAERYSEWPAYKKQVISFCAEHEVELFGVELVSNKKPTISVSLPAQTSARTHQEILHMHCEQNKLDAHTAAVGKELLDALEL